MYRAVTRKPDKGVDLDKIINALKTLPSGTPILTSIDGKQALVAAGVRTKATHAQWDEVSVSNVESTIKFTREFLQKHLGG